jgi:hypothetical protein
MARLVRHLFRPVMIVVGAAAAYGLATRLGPWAGLAAWAAITAVGCAVGAWLFHTSPLGRANWHNRVAVYFIPWGYRLGRGKLVPIAVAAWLIWMLIGVGAVVIEAWGGATAAGAGMAWTALGPHPVLAALLFASWCVYGAIVVWQLGFVIASIGTQSAMRLKFPGVCVGLTAASAALWMAGHPAWALLVGGGPLAVVGSVYGIWIGLMLTGGNKSWK